MANWSDALESELNAARQPMKDTPYEQSLKQEIAELQSKVRGYKSLLSEEQKRHRDTAALLMDRESRLRAIQNWIGEYMEEIK